MDNFDINPNDFAADNEQTPLNEAIMKILDTIKDELLPEMRENLERNENTQFRNNLTYLIQRLRDMLILSDYSNGNSELTEEEVREVLAKIENDLTEVDFNSLFAEESMSAEDFLSKLNKEKEEKDSDDWDI